jgi:hypothetical protein
MCPLLTFISQNIGTHSLSPAFEGHTGNMGHGNVNKKWEQKQLIQLLTHTLHRYIQHTSC